jgi:hypothetical protein
MATESYFFKEPSYESSLTTAAETLPHQVALQFVTNNQCMAEVPHLSNIKSGNVVPQRKIAVNNPVSFICYQAVR